jgi:hypothetical protein
LESLRKRILLENFMNYLGQLGDTCSELAQAKQEKATAKAMYDSCISRHGSVSRSYSDPSQNRCVSEVDRYNAAMNAVEAIRQRPDAMPCEAYSPSSTSLLPSSDSSSNLWIYIVIAAVVIGGLVWWKLG